MKKLFLILCISLIAIATSVGQSRTYAFDFVTNNVWDVTATVNTVLPITLKACYTTYYQFREDITIVGTGGTYTIQGSLDGNFYQPTGVSYTISAASNDTIIADTLCMPFIRAVLDTGDVTSGKIDLYIYMIRTYP